MPTIWTDKRDQRLLILLIDSVARVDADLIAKNYKHKFGAEDDYVPTARAISEHIKALQKQNGGAVKAAISVAGGKTATPRKTPTTTPKKTPTTPKTPASSAKRKWNATMSEEEDEADLSAEDSEQERKTLKAGGSPLAKRPALSRRSKSVTKSYHDQESAGAESDADDEAAKGDGATAAAATATAMDDGDGLGDFSFFDSAADVKPVMDGVDKMSVRLGGRVRNAVPQGKNFGDASAVDGSGNGVAADDRLDDSDVSSFSNDL